MFRRIDGPDQARDPLLLALAEAMLGEGPVDPGLIAKVSDPASVKARAEAEAALRERDWANLSRHEAANADLLASGARPQIVFMGDSITEAWPIADPDLFRTGRACRGLSGQTSPQMLVRFFSDVVALRPGLVHILAGTNDVAGNTGPTTPARYQANILAMLDLAQANGIGVLLGAIPPAARFHWRPDIEPSPWIAELNTWLAAQASTRGCVFVDYHAVLADADGGLKPAYTRDGVHPNRRGYAAMRGVFERAIGQARQPLR